MNMKQQQKKLLGIVLIAFLIGLTGCESDRSTDPILPGEKAVLVISFSSNPVYETSSGKFKYIIFIDEVNDTGATITSVKLETVDGEGNVTDTDRHDEAWVRRTFGTSYIRPMGRLMANIELNAAYGSERETWWLRGTDDEGNSFEYQGSVELISR
ncbi:hypothetical protein U27_02275 [Candidatus Vecturithrix granuli]|uniref:Uncharacterized protein n=1 Tax=Vecturithrix granuli TaxID=1499967 RepID=A0A0S6WAV0_VECG1|nr:hypothetical protein U27_02275 [Candidatus Vecturithrix granuli]